MPVRKIPKSHRAVTGVAASRKAVGEAQFESTLERDYLALLEFSPEVVRYEVQPVAIEWRGGRGERRRYTPDVLVEFDASLGRLPWLCEVKHRADIKKDWAELHGKFRQAIHFAKERNWRFRLISEVEIRTPYLENVRFLAPFRSRNEYEEAGEVLARLRAMGRTTPADLMGSLSIDVWKQAEWLPVLWQLVARGRVGADLAVKLTMASPIWSVS